SVLRPGISILILVVGLLLASILAGPAFAGPTGQTTKLLSDADGPLDKLELVVPFYEGILIKNPVASLREIGTPRMQLAYPGVLSAPFIAWRFGDGAWTVLYADSVTALPAVLDLEATEKEFRLGYTSYAPCFFKFLQVNGSWNDMVRKLRGEW